MKRNTTQRAWIVNLYLAGMTQADIARTVKLSRGRIGQILQDEAWRVSRWRPPAERIR